MKQIFTNQISSQSGTNNQGHSMFAQTINRFAISLVLTFFMVMNANAQTTRYVNPDGLCGGNSPCYTTIQAAVNASVNGDIIIVAAGTYNEFLLVNKSVTLLGNNQGIHPAIGTNPSATVGTRNAETILSHSGQYALSPTADNITIDGFTFSGQGTNLIYTFSSANNFHLTNCIFANNTLNSNGQLFLFGGGSHTNMLIDYNSIHDKNGVGTIYCGGGPYDNLTVQYNKFQSYGGVVYYAAGSTLTGGVIDHNEIDGESGADYNDINIGSAGNLQITNNWFHDILYTAIQCGISGGSVSGNKFNNYYGLSGSNSAAIQLWGGEYGTDVSTNVTIENNEIHYNQNGVGPVFGIRLRGADSGPGLIDGTTIHIHDNAFYDGGARGDAYAILNQGDPTKSADATCNWYASEGSQLVYQAPTFTGLVTASPHLVGGTDTQPGTIGFQTNEVCSGTCALVLSTSSTPACSPQNDGTASVSVSSGGTGSYSYLWTPGSQATDPATGLAGGSYTVTVTDVNGCAASAVQVVSANVCNATVNLNMFIEGYYLGGGQMLPVLYNEGVGTSSTDVDTVAVYLVDSALVVNDPNNPSVVGFWINDTVASAKGLLQTDGSLAVTFPPFPAGNYYIAIRQRGTLCTWSALTISIFNGQSYDFTASAAAAYGSNQVENYDQPTWSFYSGDWNQDESIDAADFPGFDYDQTKFRFGYWGSDFVISYDPSYNVLLGYNNESDDLNGDGNVDIYDYRVYDSNLVNFVASKHP